MGVCSRSSNDDDDDANADADDGTVQCWEENMQNLK